MPKLDEEYIKTGKVKYIVRDYPIESIHKFAFQAAEATHCAGEQGKYWETHDRFFTAPPTLARKDLSKHAEALGLDVAAFDKCVESGKYAARIRKDIAEGQKFSVNGTPTFFLGLTDPNGKELKSVRTIRGAQNYAGFKDAIESLLAGKK